MFHRVQNVEPNVPLVNKSASIAQGLVAAYYGTDYNAVTGKRLTRNGTMGVKQSTKGKGLSNWGTSSYLDDTSIPFVQPPFTLVSLCGSTTSGFSLFGYGGQGSGGGWVVVPAAPGTTSNGLRLTYGNISDYIFPSQYLTTSNKIECLGVKADKTTATAYMNGKKKDTVSVGTVSGITPQNARVGAIYDGTSVISTAPSDVFIGLTLLWNRALTDSEMASITDNPWQIFKSTTIPWNAAAVAYVDAPIARIQASGATGRSVSSVSNTYGSNVTAGSLLTIICVRANNPTITDVAIVLGDLTKTSGTATISTITLDKQAHESFGGFDTNIAVFSCIVLTTGSCTFTLAGTISGQMFATIGLEEHTGSWGSYRVVGTNHVGAGSGAPSTGTVTTAATALFIAGVVTETSSVETHTQNSPWLLTTEEEDGTTTLTCSLVSYVAPSATTLQATWSAPTTIPYSAIIVAYVQATVIKQYANSAFLSSQFIEGGLL